MSNVNSVSGYSNASRLLGMQIINADEKEGQIEARFDAKEVFHNHVGNVQGGILVAMLDDLMGYALGITLRQDQFAPTANLNVSFLRPIQCGTITGKGQVLKKEGAVCHLAAKLYSVDGELLASATAKAKVGDLT